MIQISKEQAEFLIESGCEWHRDVMKTKSRYPKYFACETNRVKKILGEKEDGKDAE